MARLATPAVAWEVAGREVAGRDLRLCRDIVLPFHLLRGPTTCRSVLIITSKAYEVPTEYSVKSVPSTCPRSIDCFIPPHSSCAL